MSEETRMSNHSNDTAAELAGAESICREWLPFSRDGEAICWVMVEYDRRGAELDQLRAQSATSLRNMLAAEDRELAALREADDLRDEVEQLRAQRAAAVALLDGANLRSDWGQRMRAALGVES